MSSFGAERYRLYAIGKAVKATPLLWLLSDLLFEIVNDVHERQN
jgi:hypothetical protein